MKALLILPFALLAALPQDPVKAERIRTMAVEYKDGDVALEGFLAYDQTLPSSTPRPAVIVVHEWKGLGDYAKMRAKQLAEMGYVAFAIDMYGKGVFAKDHEEAGKLAGVFFKDRSLMRGRAKAGLDTLLQQALVDKKRVAAIGYCFGGTTVLEMARAGFDVAGVASFHGNLSAPEKAKSIKARVIVFQGADDKWTAAQVPDLKKEMEEAKADFEYVEYKGAVHSFTVKEAGDDPSKGMAYNTDADKDSWEKLKAFLAKAFK